MFVERSYGSFCREFLDVYLFETIGKVREKSCYWGLDYNEERTHERLGKCHRQQTKKNWKTLI